MSHTNFNKLTKHYWVWPIAWYLFLGGLGGGILCIAGLFDIIYSKGILAITAQPIMQIGAIFALPVLIAVTLLGIGSFLLVFELGQPLVFLRVFISKTAIIKYGACLLVLAMGFGFVYFLFFLPPEWQLFYYSWVWLRDLCCVMMMLCGVGIMIYTGVLLSSMKAKPFWNTPALPVLFTVSALSTASALMSLFAGIWPAIAFDLPNQAQVQHFLVEQLHSIDAILVMVELVVLLVYVLTMYGAGNVCARSVATKWLTGTFAPAFWLGMVVCGLCIPFACYIVFGGIMATWIAPIFVLAAGLLLRFMIVYSDARRAIPGEERYWSRMPEPDAKFITAWKR